MAKNENAKKVQKIIDNLPLQEIINTAEAIAPVIPAIGPVLYVIIRILKVLLAIKPAASKVAGTVAQQGEDDICSKRESFDRMWEIAMSDGNITTEEKEFLRPRAIAAGISEDEFELMVINKTNIH